MFKDKVLLIAGGTGSFGNAVLRRFLTTNIKEIRIFSRDELKQDDMRKFYNNDKLKFYIGDVRDKNSIDDAMRGVDYVFHAAALKQVPSCEFYPMQAVKTNVIGTENLLNSAIAAGVKKVIALSTDKAVYPINAMGISKAMMERVIVAKGRNPEIFGFVVAKVPVLKCFRKESRDIQYVFLGHKRCLWRVMEPLFYFWSQPTPGSLETRQHSAKSQYRPN